MDILLSEGKIMCIEDLGDGIGFKLYNADGELENEVTWNSDAIAKMVFSDN